MGRKCSVPGCRSNYENNNYVPAFSFPKEETGRHIWIRNMNRENFEPSLTAVVCVKHFDARFVIREDRMTRDDGTLLVVQRKKLSLTAEAVPTIFPKQTSRLTKILPCKRKSPTEKREKLIARDEEIKKRLEDDYIASIKELIEGYSPKLSPHWKTVFKSGEALLHTVNFDNYPKIFVSLKIKEDSTVKLWHSGVELGKDGFQWKLRKQNKCDTWTQLDCLLNVLSSYEFQDIPFKKRLEAIVNILDKCYERMDAKSVEENLQKNLEKKSEVIKTEPELELGLELKIAKTTVTPTTLTTPHIDPSNLSTLGPSSKMEPNSSMTEQEVHSALTCEVYPADDPQPVILTKIKDEPIDIDEYKQGNLFDADTKEASVTKSQVGSLFQPPVLIKEEPVYFEEEL